MWFYINHKSFYNNKGRSMGVDALLFSDRIQIERKQFFFDLKENASGRFLRITEEVGGRRDAIIVPATGLEIFQEKLDNVIDENKQNQDTEEE
jgi:hypothetical protein